MFSALTDGFGDSQGPIPGQLAQGKMKGPDFSSVEVKYLVANMQDDIDRMQVEEIMTKSLRSLNDAIKPGDIVVFREDNTFTKSGEYFIAIKYAVRIESENDPEEEKI